MYLHKLLYLIVCKQEGICQPNENCGCVPAWMHGWVCIYVYALATLSISFHRSFATVLVTAGCPVSSNLSYFTVQAVVELLSLCGLSVVSGPLTQDLLKWGVFPSVSCFKPTYTHRHKHLNTSPHADMRACMAHMGCEDIWICGEINCMPWSVSDNMTVRRHCPGTAAFSVMYVL